MRVICKNCRRLLDEDEDEAIKLTEADLKVMKQTKNNIPIITISSMDENRYVTICNTCYYGLE